MLRISQLDSDGRTATLRVDGSLSGVWVGELRRLCEVTLASGDALNIDCGGISFSDTEGVALMNDLRKRQVALTNCPPLLQFQLGQGPAL
jgi:ABC-type transporter Mla MlaB component